MNKKSIKRILTITLLFIFFISITGTKEVFAKSINPNDYIVGIKIKDMNTEEDVDFFKMYGIKDGKIKLTIANDKGLYYKAFLEPERGMHLDGSKLIIETNNIRTIKVENSATDGYVEPIVSLEKEAGEWKSGVRFSELGGTYEGEMAACFDEHKPPIFTFTTTTNETFQLTWEIIKYTPPEKEFEVGISIVPQNSYDETAKAGISKIVGGKEIFNSNGRYKIGDEVTIKATDGDKSKFSHWSTNKLYKTPPVGHDPGKAIKLEEFIGDINERELKFKINEQFKNIRGFNDIDALSINAFYDVSTKITMKVEQDNPKLTATVDEDLVAEDKDFKITAKSEDDGWVFDRWEISPPITGFNTKNPDANINSEELTLKMPKLMTYDASESYKLEVTAHFKEKAQEPTIVSLKDVQAEIELGDAYTLPTEVEAKMSDGSIKNIKILSWDPKTIEDDIKKTGEYTYSGALEGTSEKATLKLEVKEKAVVPPEETLEINMVELIKEDNTIATGEIKDKDIKIRLPESMSQEEIKTIALGGYRLRIKATEGTNVIQDKGYDGDWSSGITNSVYANTPTKFTIYKGDKSVDYTIEILAPKVDPIPPTIDEYTVTFNSNGGSKIKEIRVKKDKKISRPIDPTKENNKFVGWYEDSGFANVFDFNTGITKHITLYGRWKQEEKPEKPEKPEPEKPTPEPEKPVQKKDAEIINFNLLGVEGSINHSTGEIYVDLPYRTNLNNLVPVISYSEGATISPSIGTAKNFNSIVKYTISGKELNPKTYKVDVSIPKEKEYEEIINRNQDWYRDRDRDRYRDRDRRRRDDRSWYEITQEIKKERLEREERKTWREIRNTALDEVGRITAQSGNMRRDLTIIQFDDYMEIKLNSKEKNNYRSQINIPSGVLTQLKELKFDYLKYSTDLVRIRVYPFMDSSDGARINLKAAPSEANNNIQSIWSKIKGAGKIFEIESNSTKSGFSFEMKLDQNLPAEYIRVVKYNYMTQKFEDLNPEKWSVMGGHVYVEQVSGGIYGVIYNK